MKKLYTSISFAVLGFFLKSPLIANAVVVGNNDPIALEPNSTQDNLKKLTDVRFTVPNLIKTSITIVLIVAALLFFAMLVIGGIRWIMSGGEKGNVENARKQITNALIGLAIVFVAWAIVRLVAIVFGIDILNFTVPQIGA